ncbi:MAG: opioid growth factor receptor-related protein [Phycisphaerae bacterium]
MSLISFYLNESPDSAGRRLADIWAFSLDELEYHHDFIQWLFPLDTPSPVNPDAPTLDANTIRLFRANPQLRANLLHSLDKMLYFYGLTRTDPTITRVPNFPDRSPNWLRPNNHNHLRLTRILRSTHLLGLEKESAALLQCLLEIAADLPTAITPTTLRFWQSATKAPGP